MLEKYELMQGTMNFFCKKFFEKEQNANILEGNYISLVTPNEHKSVLFPTCSLCMYCIACPYQEFAECLSLIPRQLRIQIRQQLFLRYLA